MHRFQIKIRTIFLELLLVYPIINIMGCVFFHGDNMTTLSLSYCSILILLYVTDVKKLSRKNIYILIIFAFILILEIYRDQNMFILFVTFIFANIMLSIYSSNKIMVKEYIEYFVKKKEPVLYSSVGVFNNPFFICYEKWPYSGMEYLGFTGTLQLSTYIGISFFIYDDVRHFLFYRVSRKVCNSIYSSKLCLYYFDSSKISLNS